MIAILLSRAMHLIDRRWTHVVAGRVEPEGRLGSHFAWVAQHRPCDPEMFMKAALENNVTPESQVRVMADKADGLSNLVGVAAGKTTERILD